uniref:Putative translational regulator n=1 Tax=viral metagenome TaxID=1070528 RepID=A0A6M3J8A9_9ZZZZ
MAQIELVELRCVKCHQLLAKIEADALRIGKLLEIKCAKCNAFFTTIGDEPDSQRLDSR